MEGAVEAQVEGPIEAASAWVNAILRRGSLAVAWPLTDPDNRESLAESWVAENQDHPALAGEDLETIVEDLASLEPERLELWHYFDASTVLCFRSALANVDLDSWGWATNPRPVAIDFEAVILVDAGPLDEDNRPTAPGPYPAIGFLMHYVEGAWLVNAVTSPEEEPAPSAA
jgi:hypothetical protein